MAFKVKGIQVNAATSAEALDLFNKYLGGGAIATDVTPLETTPIITPGVIPTAPAPVVEPVVTPAVTTAPKVSPTLTSILTSSPTQTAADVANLWRILMDEDTFKWTAEEQATINQEMQNRLDKINAAAKGQAPAAVQPTAPAAAPVAPTTPAKTPTAITQARAGNQTWVLMLQGTTPVWVQDVNQQKAEAQGLKLAGPETDLVQAMQHGADWVPPVTATPPGQTVPPPTTTTPTLVEQALKDLGNITDRGMLDTVYHSYYDKLSILDQMKLTDAYAAAVHKIDQVLDTEAKKTGQTPAQTTTLRDTLSHQGITTVAQINQWWTETGQAEYQQLRAKDTVAAEKFIGERRVLLTEAQTAENQTQVKTAVQGYGEPGTWTSRRAALILGKLQERAGMASSVNELIALGTSLLQGTGGTETITRADGTTQEKATIVPSEDTGELNTKIKKYLDDMIVSVFTKIPMAESRLSQAEQNLAMMVYSSLSNIQLALLQASVEERIDKVKNGELAGDEGALDKALLKLYPQQLSNAALRSGLINKLVLEYQKVWKLVHPNESIDAFIKDNPAVLDVISKYNKDIQAAVDIALFNKISAQSGALSLAQRDVIRNSTEFKNLSTAFQAQSKYTNFDEFWQSLPTDVQAGTSTALQDTLSLLSLPTRLEDNLQVYLVGLGIKDPTSVFTQIEKIRARYLAGTTTDIDQFIKTDLLLKTMIATAKEAQQTKEQPAQLAQAELWLKNNVKSLGYDWQAQSTTAAMQDMLDAFKASKATDWNTWLGSKDGQAQWNLVLDAATTAKKGKGKAEAAEVEKQGAALLTRKVWEIAQSIGIPADALNNADIISLLNNVREGFDYGTLTKAKDEDEMKQIINSLFGKTLLPGEQPSTAQYAWVRNSLLNLAPIIKTTVAQSQQMAAAQAKSLEENTAKNQAKIAFSGRLTGFFSDAKTRAQLMTWFDNLYTEWQSSGSAMPFDAWAANLGKDFLSSLIAPVSGAGGKELPMTTYKQEAS